jgi:hypothetical protein
MSKDGEAEIQTHLGEVSLDPVSVRLLLGQSWPVLGLSHLLSENEDDSSGSRNLLGLLFVRSVQLR